MKQKILVVEDDMDVRSGLVEVLDSEGYVVETAENGQVALDLLSSLKELPHLILLDLMMPVMDGLTFLQTLKNHPNPDFQRIPVVITTASRNDGIKKTSGIAGFLGKPIDLDELFATVSACLLKPESVEMQP